EPLAVRTRAGYLPGELHLDDNLTAEGALRLYNRLRRGRADWTFVRQLTTRLDLDLGTPIKNLSKGNKQKVGVVQALMHRPELLLEEDGRRGVVLQVEGEMDALIKALAAFPVSDFETERPSLEEIFRAYYAGAEAK